MRNSLPRTQAMSQKLELNSNNNLVNEMYNSSLDCSWVLVSGFRV